MLSDSSRKNKTIEISSPYFLGLLTFVYLVHLGLSRRLSNLMSKGLVQI